MADYSSKTAIRSFGGPEKDAEDNFLITQAHHLAYNDGKILVSEMLSHCVKVFQAADGAFVKRFGEMGFFDGEFDVPAGIAFLDGNIIVCDSNNGRLQSFDSDGEFLSEYGSKGADPGCFVNPNSICVDAEAQNVFVAEAGNCRVQILDKDFSHKSFISGAPFKSSNHVGYDNTNKRVIVTDCDADNISLFDPTTGQLVLSLKGDEGEFKGAQKATADKNGNILVCEMGKNKVVSFDKNGKKIGLFAEKHEFSYPEDIFINDNEIYVLETNVLAGWSRVTVF